MCTKKTVQRDSSPSQVQPTTDTGDDNDIDMDVQQIHYLSPTIDENTAGVSM